LSGRLLEKETQDVVKDCGEDSEDPEIKAILDEHNKELAKLTQRMEDEKKKQMDILATRFL